MAQPSCPKCQNHVFEVLEYSPKKSNFKIMLIQCNLCGTVVGAMDYFAVGTLVKGIEEQIKELALKVDTINRKVK